MLREISSRRGACIRPSYPRIKILGDMNIAERRVPDERNACAAEWQIDPLCASPQCLRSTASRLSCASSIEETALRGPSPN